MKISALPRLFAVLLGTMPAALAHAALFGSDAEEAPPWAEEGVALPAFPDSANLREFRVSEITSNRFYIDALSITPGKDGVVRYTLVVRTGGGATNVSFEGIRCDTHELKVYATGRTDGAWSNVRKVEWRPIKDKPMNRQHAVLWGDLFCPGGIAIGSREEGLEALRLGKHPQVP